jgi:hypothetical protein
MSSSISSKPRSSNEKTWLMKNTDFVPADVAAGVDPSGLEASSSGRVRSANPMMPLDLKMRPAVDEKYTVPKAIEYIKRNAAEKKPFFVYVGYSEVHPPMMPHPDRTTSPPSAVERLPTSSPRRTTASARFWMRSRKRASTTTRSSSGGGTIPQFGPGSNGPYRGDFFNTPFEGTMRVPAMIRWPGKVPSGGRHGTDARRSGLAADVGRDGGCVETGAEGSTDRWRRRLGLHPGQKRHDWPRYLRVLRRGRRADVDQIEVLQNDLPLHG